MPEDREPREQVKVVMDAELLRRMDAARGDVSRSMFVTRAVEARCAEAEAESRPWVGVTASEVEFARSVLRAGDAAGGRS